MFSDASNPHRFDTLGARVGGHFGVNWQVAPTRVVGAETDIGFSDVTSKVTGIVGCTIACGVVFPPGILIDRPTPPDQPRNTSENGAIGGRPTAMTPASDSTSIRTSWDGSLRARAGFLMTPDFLAYGTGGIAERMLDANITCDSATSPLGVTCKNQTFDGHLQAGWTAGGGIEWKVMSNLLLRGEYRYSQYGNWSPTFLSSGLGSISTNINSHTQMALFGASYLFGGTPVK